MKSERNYALDFIKALSALFIVLHHYWQITNIGTVSGINFYGEYIPWGYLVELFFIISGFFMYKYIPQITEKQITAKKWYLKRTLRLLPVAAISVVVYDIVHCLYQNIDYVSRFVLFDMPFDIVRSVLCCLGLQEGYLGVYRGGNSPLWYVSVLITCYMIFYFITYISAYIKVKPYIFYVIMIIAGVLLYPSDIRTFLITYNTTRGYYSFFAGVMLAYIINNLKNAKIITSISVIIIVAFAAIFWFKPQNIIGVENYLLTFFLYPAIVVVSQNKFVRKIFSSRIWGEVGAISYGLYVWHIPLLLIYFTIIDYFKITVDFAAVTTIAVFLAAVGVVAVISYYFIEKPISKLINKII